MTSIQNQFLELSQKAQSTCQYFIHTASPSSPLVEAFLCGKNAPHDSGTLIFKKAGLIHLLVVSGAHLVMLCFFLELLFLEKNSSGLRATLKSLVIFLFLMAFVIFTGGQAPTVRAFVAFSYRRLNLFFRWRQPPIFQNLLAGLITLSLFPDWILSISFYLSWVASLGLMSPTDLPSDVPLNRSRSHQSKEAPPSRKRIWVKIFVRHFLITLQIQILVSVLFSAMSPVFFFANLLITPILAWVLWPLCFLSIFTSLNGALTDPLWNGILKFLSAGEQFFAAETPRLLAPSTLISNSTSTWSLLWGFALCCQFIFWFQRIHRYRGHNV